MLDIVSSKDLINDSLSGQGLMIEVDNYTLGSNCLIDVIIFMKIE